MQSDSWVYWFAGFIVVAMVFLIGILPPLLDRRRYRACGSVSAKHMTKRQRRNTATAIANHAAANAGGISAEALAFLQEYRSIAEPDELKRVGQLMDESFAQKKMQLRLLRIAGGFFLYFCLPGILPLSLLHLTAYWAKGEVNGDITFQLWHVIITLSVMAFVVIYRLARHKPLRRLLVCWGLWAILALLGCLGEVPSGHPARGVLIGLILIIIAALFVTWLRNRNRQAGVIIPPSSMGGMANVTAGYLFVNRQDRDDEDKIE